MSDWLTSAVKLCVSYGKNHSAFFLLSDITYNISTLHAIYTNSIKIMPAAFEIMVQPALPPVIYFLRQQVNKIQSSSVQFRADH